jgi:hypothetical protein
MMGRVKRQHEAIATAIAFRWLSDWSERGMKQAALEVLEISPRASVTVLVRKVRAQFVRPPHHAPTLLIAAIRDAGVLRSSANAKRVRNAESRRDLVAQWPVAPALGAQRASAYAMPATVGDLVALLDIDPARFDALVDLRAMAKRASPRQSHYAFTWIPKSSGGARLLESPKPRLKQAQRAILDRLLAQVPAHPSAHGFVRGHSIETFVRPHVARPLVVRLDLEDFFGSIHAGRVQGIFRQVGCSDDVARALAGLCTTRTPSRVLRRRPRYPEEGVQRIVRERARLGAPHLPQGAPTSPALANLAAFRLDLRLAGLADALGARYTRYADDLAFSFDRGNHQRARFEETIEQIAREEGFRIATHKTRWMRPHQRQLLGGLVINGRAQIPRRDYDTIRALLHRASRDGLAALDVDVIASRRAAHLLGKATWSGTGSASRTRRIRTALSFLSSRTAP